jgi:hypothetical protein
VLASYLRIEERELEVGGLNEDLEASEPDDRIGAAPLVPRW